MNLSKPLDRLLSGFPGDGIGATVLKGGGAAFTIRILGLGAALVAEVLIARLLGVRSYGEYAFALSLISILAIFAKLGMDNLRVRFIPAYVGSGEWGLLRGVLERSRQCVSVMAVLIAVVMVCVVWLIRDTISHSLLATLLLACILLPVLTVVQVQAGSLRAFKLIIAAQGPGDLLRPLLLAAGVVLAVVVLEFPASAPVAMGANLVASSIVLPLLSFLLVRAIPEQAKRARPQFRTREWILVGYQMLLITGFSILLSRFDIIMLGTLSGTVDAGIYAAATRIAALILLVLNAINTIVAPLISQLYAQGRMQELQRMIAFAARIIFLITLPINLGVIVFGPWMLGLFGSGFISGYAALVILSVGQMINALAGSVGFITIQTGHQKVAAYVFGGSAVLNILLNFILIPAMGIVGAAIATAVTIVTWNSILVFFVLKHLRINPTILALTSSSR